MAIYYLSVNPVSRGAGCSATSTALYRAAERIGELLQLHGIDPLTVAHQTGTSLAMIEKTYFRFIQSAVKNKLEAAR